jgi:ubiquitin-like domain-containing CTD phosphatase 1
VCQPFFSDIQAGDGRAFVFFLLLFPTMDAPPTTSAADAATPATSLPFKWTSLAFEVSLPPTATVADVKAAIEARTHVPAARQKILGLKTVAGKPAADADTVAHLAPAKPGGRFMVLGAAGAVDPAVALAAAAAEAAAGPPLEDDWASDDSAPGRRAAEDEVPVPDRPENQEKLARRIAAFTPVIRAPPRPGKKLLVCDIDYCLFDLGGGPSATAVARPFLARFFAAVYPHYDIHIWSASSMKFVELKMREMGVADDPRFTLSAYYDHRAMVTVRTARHGVYDCKPLPLIWANFPGQYGPHNTIMLDDLKRNYVFNPAQGLVIRPYKRSATTAATDRELEKLCVYLLDIAGRATFEGLRHSRWERTVGADRLARLLAAPPGRGLAALGLEKGGHGGDGGEGGGGGQPPAATPPADGEEGGQLPAGG